MILPDTTVLIEYFRTQDKARTFFYELAKDHSDIAISTITKYEVFVGSNDLQNKFWENLLEAITVFSFDEAETMEAVKIQKELLKKNKIIGFGDIAIGATARVHRLEITTLNRKHFERIENLKLLQRK